MLKYFKNTFSTAIVNRGDLVQVRLPFGTQLGVVLDRVGIYDGLALRPDGGRIKFKQRDVDLVVANWLPVTADSESKIVNKVLKLNTSARNLSNSCKSGMAKVYGKLRMRKVVKLSEIGKELFGEGRLSTEQLVGTKLALQSGMYFVMVTPVDCQMDPCYNPRHPKEVKFLLDLYQNKHEKEVGNFVLKAKNLIQDYRQG